jgi:hypothetical protein
LRWRALATARADVEEQQRDPHEHDAEGGKKRRRRAREPTIGEDGALPDPLVEHDRAVQDGRDRQDSPRDASARGRPRHSKERERSARKNDADRRVRHDRAIPSRDANEPYLAGCPPDEPQRSRADRKNGRELGNKDALLGNSVRAGAGHWCARNLPPRIVQGKLVGGADGAGEPTLGMSSAAPKTAPGRNGSGSQRTRVLVAVTHKRHSIELYPSSGRE